MECNSTCFSNFKADRHYACLFVREFCGEQGAPFMEIYTCVLNQSLVGLALFAVAG
jgi:hypothetical protein